MNIMFFFPSFTPDFSASLSKSPFWLGHACKLAEQGPVLFNLKDTPG
jgi:hypothetical protein